MVCRREQPAEIFKSCRKLTMNANMNIESPAPSVATPAYLQDVYWWAYVHKNAVKIFERRWLINLILWGNFKKLRDTVLNELGTNIPGKTLQVACVYGDFSTCLAERIAMDGWLDIVDVLPIQLNNMRNKLTKNSRVTLYLRDSTDLGFVDASYDQVVVFFLLHEQPEAVRRKTLSEALRTLKPGGRLVIADYHLPHRMHPLRYLFRHALDWLEPFALDLWRHDLITWLPACVRPEQITKRTYFGGLYQKVVVRV